MYEICFHIVVSAVSFTCQLVESQDSFLHPVSSCSCRRGYQELYFFWFQLGQYLVDHRCTGSSLLFFCRTELVTPVRHCSVNTELIYRKNCLEQEFWVHRISVEVNGGLIFFCFNIPRLKALILLNTGWPVSLNRCTMLLAVESHCPFWAWLELPYHFSSEPGPKNVQCPSEHWYLLKIGWPVSLLAVRSHCPL